MTIAVMTTPIVFTLFAWWFSTGAILYLDGLPRHTYRWSLTGASVLLVAALAGLHQVRDDGSLLGAYCSFSCALMVWGWVEMSFLMGYVTGPRVSNCPAGSRGWQKVGFAIETVLHHEIALLVTMLLVVVLGWNGENRIGQWVFGILWLSRLSAKLNIFLGARNLSEELLPAHLRYLHTYFTRRSMNPFFPVAIVVLIAATCLFARAAMLATSEVESTGWVLLTTLAFLSLLEHGFLMLPMPSNRLWSWALASRQT